jgi:ABC-type transport system involved in cytochrome c biogenesis permease component
MDKKLDVLMDMAAQAQGAGKATMLFGRWGYGVIGAIGGAIITNWQAFKRLF